MLCPQCGEEIRVIDSRASHMNKGNDGILLRRRRSCNNCHVRFTTYEVTEAVIRALMADQLRLRLLQDAMSGRGTVEEHPKFKSIPKMLEYATTEGKK